MIHRSKRGSRAHFHQGSWLGALAADLRDYESMAEKVFFFVHHAVIVVIPILYLRWDTFPIYPLEMFGTYVVVPSILSTVVLNRT